MKFDPIAWVEQIEGLGCRVDASPGFNEIGFSSTDPSVEPAISMEISKLNPDQRKAVLDYLRQRGR
jgi:hypothetical protein